MKRILTLTLFVIATLSMWGQAENEWDEPVRKLQPVVLPGAGHINVESLLKDIDMKMDVSQLSLSECRVLRNAFAARQGYAFMAGDLRAIFQTTSWYDSLLWARYEKEEELISKYYEPNAEGEIDYDAAYAKMQKDNPLKYTKEQIAFIRKLRNREAELMRQNFTVSPGYRVNTGTLVNPWQLKNPDPRLMDALGRNGFAIVPNTYEQLFHVYERNDYHDFPSFVTTDLYLQLFHMYFDGLLREVEEKKIYGFIGDFCQQMQDRMLQLCQSKDKETKAAAAYDAAFFSIAHALLSDDSIEGANNALSPGLTPAYREMAVQELQHVFGERAAFSQFLEYDEVMFNYGLFRPRGHYTRTDSLSRYFRAMMWLQTVPFGTDKERQLKRALLMAHVIGSTPTLRQTYLRVSEPITYLMGTPDNVTILQVFDEIAKTGLSPEQLMKNKKAMATLRKNIESIGERQTRIRPKFEYTSHCKINLMPQRYMPDAEVLQEMVDYTNWPTKRSAPKGLDFFAALGNTAAERILIDELKEATRWDGYRPMLQKMRQRMSEINWQENVSTQWMDALGTMIGTSQHKADREKLPYFMQTPQWEKKDLNAALASWAELKHDAILYAKQPMGAECGDAGPPAPVVKAYVEPNISFWTKAISLTDAILKVLDKYQLSTPFATDITRRLREEAEFLLNISRKELEGGKITDEEYYQLEVIGATYENITLDLIRRPDQWLQGWSDVVGADKSVAVVADVYTANADNNPAENRTVLYEAIGPASEIYVVVEIGGYLYLTRGAVFSYREFQRALSEPRMTDEEWQLQLQKQPAAGTPSWLQEIIVPMETEPQDNEYIFYSSGC